MHSNFIQRCSIYGDSISTTNFSGGGFQHLLTEKLQIPIVVNYAKNASALTAEMPDSLVELLTDDANILLDSDLILIWMGTNDWYWGAELGNVDNFSEKTFCGAIRHTIKRLSAASPFANLVWITPICRYQAPDEIPYAGDAFYTKNKKNYTLLDYCTAIHQMSDALGFAVCDMRTLSGFTMENRSFFLRDDVHPSAVGYRRIAEIIARFIDNLSFLR